MGWCEGDKRCKKHPEHTLSKGVCPSCLREKLTNLSATSSATTSMQASSSTSSSAGGSSGANSSAARSRRGAAVGPLKKSRSMATVVASEEDRRKRRKRGLWARIMGVSGRRREGDGGGAGLKQSKTFKEKPSAKWIFFS